MNDLLFKRKRRKSEPLRTFFGAPACAVACNDGAQNGYVIVDGRAWPVGAPPAQPPAAGAAPPAAPPAAGTAPPVAPPAAPPAAGAAGRVYTEAEVAALVNARVADVNARSEAARAAERQQFANLARTLGVDLTQPGALDAFITRKQQEQLQQQVQGGTPNEALATLQRQLEEQRQAHEQEAQRMRDQLAARAIEAELQQHLSRTADPANAAVLLRDKLAYNHETGSVYVKADGTDGPRLDGAGGVMGVGSYVDSWIQANPVFQRPAQTGAGAGTGAGAHGAGAHGVTRPVPGQDPALAGYVERPGGGVDVAASFDAMAKALGVDKRIPGMARSGQ